MRRERAIVQSIDSIASVTLRYNVFLIHSLRIHTPHQEAFLIHASNGTFLCGHTTGGWLHRAIR